MPQYVAIMNTPGYMPWDDGEPAVFDTPRDAWEYLADERREQEDQAAMVTDDDQPYSDTVSELETASANGDLGVIYGGIPGYDGSHDLGVAYSVDIYTPED